MLCAGAPLCLAQADARARAAKGRRSVGRGRQHSRPRAIKAGRLAARRQADDGLADGSGDATPCATARGSTRCLLLRLDPEGFDPETKEHAAEGVVAYSAICPHTGCDVTNWHPDRQLLECPCHYSIYDPKEGAKVVSGPSPRRLPALPLKIVDGRLVVAKPFTGRAGFQQM